MAYLPSSRTFTVDMTKISGHAARRGGSTRAPANPPPRASSRQPASGSLLRPEKAIGCLCWTMPLASSAHRDKIKHRVRFMMLVKICSLLALLLLQCLHVNIDEHLVAHHDSASVERGVPADPEIMTVYAGCGVKTGACYGPFVDAIFPVGRLPLA